MRDGEVSVMNPLQQTAGHADGASSVVHLLITAGEVKKLAESPEQVMEEIWLRATQIGSVLENILHEPHGQPRWGLNE
jgi:hypothetical protein